MRLVIGIFASLLFWLSCVGLDIKTMQSDSFAERWPPIISFLNIQSPSLTEISHEAATDLLRLRKDELAQIKYKFSQVTKNNLTTIELRNLENKFFYDEISKLNNKTFLSLNTKAAKDYAHIAQRILNIIETNNITSSKNTYEFDNSNEIGFCFGRAMLVHYFLIKAGIDPQDILKIFTLGELLVDHQFWHFHVAIMLRDSMHGYIIVDPLFENPLAYKTWIEKIHQYEIKYPFSRARFYITDPRKFLPASGFYDLASLSQQILRGYFNKIIAEINVIQNQLEY